MRPHTVIPEVGYRESSLTLLTDAWGACFKMDSR